MEQHRVVAAILKSEDEVLLCHRSATGLELTVWLITSWDGIPENCQTEEHDAIGWFSAARLADLELADEAYLPLLRSVLA